MTGNHAMKLPVRHSASLAGVTRTNHSRKGVAALCGALVALALTGCSSDPDVEACEQFVSAVDELGLDDPSAAIFEGLDLASLSGSLSEVRDMAEDSEIRSQARGMTDYIRLMDDGGFGAEQVTGGIYGGEPMVLAGVVTLENYCSDEYGVPN